MYEAFFKDVPADRGALVYLCSFQSPMCFSPPQYFCVFAFERVCVCVCVLALP